MSEDFSYTVYNVPERLVGGGVKDDVKMLVGLIKSGNFKLGAALTILQRLGLWRFVEMYFNKQIDDCLGKLSSNARRPIEAVLVNLVGYKDKHPREFKALYDQAKDTKDFNNKGLNVLIFLLVQCPEAVGTILKTILNAEFIYDQLMYLMPLPQRVSLKLIFNTLIAVGIAPSFNKLFKKCNSITFNIVDKLIRLPEQLFGDRDLLQYSFDILIKVVGPVFSKTINTIDPIGIILPASTFICHNIICKKVAMNVTSLWQMNKTLKHTLIAVAVILIIVLIVRIRKNKESFDQSTSIRPLAYFNHGQRLLYPRYLDPLNHY